MQVTVQVRGDVAPALHGRGGATAAVEQLQLLTNELGVTLEPTHPGSDDPLLAPWFTAEVPDEQADRVLEALRSNELIEAAYVKPPAELP